MGWKMRWKNALVRVSRRRCLLVIYSRITRHINVSGPPKPSMMESSDCATTAVSNAADRGLSLSLQFSQKVSQSGKKGPPDYRIDIQNMSHASNIHIAMPMLRPSIQGHGDEYRRPGTSLMSASPIAWWIWSVALVTLPTSKY
jgi:hypothetical protein